MKKNYRTLNKFTFGAHVVLWGMIVIASIVALIFGDLAGLGIFFIGILVSLTSLIGLLINLPRFMRYLKADESPQIAMANTYLFQAILHLIISVSGFVLDPKNLWYLPLALLPFEVLFIVHYLYTRKYQASIKSRSIFK